MMEQLESFFLEENDPVVGLLRDRINEKESFTNLIKSDAFLKLIPVEVSSSPGEILLMLLMYCKKYAPSLEGLSYLCKIINRIFALPVFPESAYLLNEMCSTQSKVTYYKMCPECSLVLLDSNASTVECIHCKKLVKVPKNYSSTTFALIDPSDIISRHVHFYEDHYNFVVKERPRTRDIIKDIYDGRMYKKLVNSLAPSDKHQYVTLTLNTDGAEPFKSSNDSAWPIYVMINELPLEKRFKHIITVCTWFGKSQPIMSVYMDEFVKMMNKIKSTGINCIVKGEERSLKPYVINSTDDTPARKKCNGKTNFNSYEGCDWCYRNGFWYAGNMRYIVDGEIELRDANTTMTYMLKAQAKGLPIHGVKHISPLIFLEEFDIDESFSVDQLHAIDSGAGKQGTKFIYHRKLNPLQRDLCDQYLLQIRAPSSISRLTRSLKQRSTWKAKEWQN